jgi:hypothetical protein
MRKTIKLSAIGLVAAAFLVACAGADETSAQGTDALDVPSFLGKGAATNVELGGHAAKQLATSKDVAAATSAMKDSADNVEVHAAAYQMSPIDAAELKDPLNCFAPRGYIAYDVMFRADGSRPNQSAGFGWATGWQPQFETNHCAAVDPSKAVKRFRRSHGYATAHGAGDAQKRALLENDSVILVHAMLKGASAAKLYGCHWDNNDDTDVDALVSVDYKTGQVRTLMAFAGG